MLIIALVFILSACNPPISTVDDTPTEIKESLSVEEYQALPDCEINQPIYIKEDSPLKIRPGNLPCKCTMFTYTYKCQPPGNSTPIVDYRVCRETKREGKEKEGFHDYYVVGLVQVYFHQSMKYDDAIKLFEDVGGKIVKYNNDEACLWTQGEEVQEKIKVTIEVSPGTEDAVVESLKEVYEVMHASKVILS